jgi:hypothetical protein
MLDAERDHALAMRGGEDDVAGYEDHCADSVRGVL